MLARRVGRFLKLQPGELAPVSVLFLWYFCVIGAAFVGRAVRDALFLAHLSAERLPAMYVASPLAMTLVGLLYARVEGRLRRDRLVVGTAAASGAIFLAARFLLGTGDWIYYALYVAASVIQGLIIMQLWTVASDRFTSRDAKRLFGLIGAGGTAADIAVGAALALLAPRTGAENLLYLGAGLLFAAAGLAVLLRRLSGGRIEARPRPPLRRVGKGKWPPGASHLALVGGALVCSVAVVTLVEFQFKAITASAFGGDRAGMVRYFGDMSIATGVVSLAIQLVATRWLLHRLGVVGALLVLPLGLGAGEIGLLLAPGIIAGTILKASDETIRFTINDAGSQLLFLPVPSQARGRWKALVENAWKPGAQLGLGILLVGYRAIVPDAAGRIAPLVAVALAVIVVWTALLVRLRGAYVRSLRETLRQRPPEVDGAAVPREEITALRGVFAGGTPAQILAALELAGPISAELGPELVHLAGAEDARVRAAACSALAKAVTTTPDARAALRARLTDEDPTVRRRALGGLLGATDAAALRARDVVAALCASEAPADRIEAAAVFAAAGPPAARPGAVIDAVARVAGLLDDADPAVARAAVAAAGALGTPALVPRLLDRLARGADPEAAAALARCGAGAEKLLDAALADSPARREIAIALGNVGTPAALELLALRLDEADPVLATVAGRALARAVRRAPNTPIDRKRLRGALDRELAAAYRALAAADGLGRAESALAPDGSRAAPAFRPDAPEGAAALLSKALRDRQDRARDRGFALVEALYPAAGVAMVHANLQEPDPARRANAVEVLDSALDADLRARIVPLVDESPRYAKLAAVASIYPLPKLAQTGWITELLADPEPWMLACAAYYAGAHRIGAATARLEELLGHTDDVVRETALVALAALLPAPRLATLAAGLCADPFPALARRAAVLAAT